MISLTLSIYLMVWIGFAWRVSQAGYGPAESLLMGLIWPLQIGVILADLAMEEEE